MLQAFINLNHFPHIYQAIFTALLLKIKQETKKNLPLMKKQHDSVKLY
jgi:hypothetical protein